MPWSRTLNLQNWEINVHCIQVTQSTVICHRNVNELRQGLSWLRLCGATSNHISHLVSSVWGLNMTIVLQVYNTPDHSPLYPWPANTISQKQIRNVKRNGYASFAPEQNLPMHFYTLLPWVIFKIFSPKCSYGTLLWEKYEPLRTACICDPHPCRLKLVDADILCLISTTESVSKRCVLSQIFDWLDFQLSLAHIIS